MFLFEAVSFEPLETVALKEERVKASQAERRHVASLRSVPLLFPPPASSSRLVSTQRRNATFPPTIRYKEKELQSSAADSDPFSLSFISLSFDPSGGSLAAAAQKSFFGFFFFCLRLMRLIKKIRGEVTLAGRRTSI